MALFTDGNPSTIEDLRCYESSLLDVARVEQIDLDSKLQLAAGEVGEQIAGFLLRRPSQDPQAGSRRQIGLSTVVVSDALKRWHSLHALFMVYSDAYGSQLNDRYLAKRDQYGATAERAKRHTIEFGIGLVGNPVPRAAGVFCASVAGSSASMTYFVSASWVGATEGAASYPTTFETTAGSELSVATGPAPAGVTGWNVFVGTSRDSMARQNPETLAAGEAWLSAGGLIAGAAPASGQVAEFWVVENRTSQRG